MFYKGEPLSLLSPPTEKNVYHANAWIQMLFTGAINVIILDRTEIRTTDLKL